MASCTACTHSAAPGLLTDLQGEAAKKTVQLAFEKIRSLQQDLEDKCKVGGCWQLCMECPLGRSFAAQCTLLHLHLMCLGQACPHPDTCLFLFAALLQEIKDLDCKLEAEADVAQQLATELEQQKAALAAAEAAAAASAAEAESARSTVKQLKADLKKQQAAANKLAEEQAALKAALHTAQEEAAVEKQRAEAAGAEAQDGAKQLSAAQERVAALQAQLQASKAAAQAAQGRVAELEAELAAQQRRAADVATGAANWEAEQLRLTAEIARMREAQQGDAAARGELAAAKAAAEVGSMWGGRVPVSWRATAVAHLSSGTATLAGGHP